MLNRFRLGREAKPQAVAPAICHNIRLWCETHPGSSYRVLVSEQVARRRLPRTLEPTIHPSFHGLLHVAVPPRALVVVRNGRVIGPHGLVVLPDGAYVGELIAVTDEGQRRMLEQETAYTAPPTSLTRLHGRYYPLMVIGWTNYYHWCHDVLARLWAVLDTLPSDVRFLTSAPLRPFQVESLRAVGIAESRVTVMESGGVVCDELFFSPPVQKTQLDTKQPFEWLRARALETFGSAPTTARRRILLDRTGDNHYRTINGEEVQAVLQPYGFETVHPGHLSFREQVQLFSGAEVIVGTGTGLTNMLYAPPGARILQFQEPTKIIHALWTLSEALGHEYWYLMANRVPSPSASLPDVHVPPDKLAATLKAMLAEDAN